jgi:hypothetical protein
MNEKELLEQTRKLKALIKKQQLAKAIEIVGEISKIMIIGLSIAVFIIWIFNL